MKKAAIFFGSNKEFRENIREIKNPFTKKVVSSHPICDIKDAKRALEIANSAKKSAKVSPLHQRINWILDVANYIESSKEEFAQAIVDEIAKPISFARAEVDRAIETIRLTALSVDALEGKRFSSDIMPSGKKTEAFFIREPVGVVVAITPFNFPLNLVAHKLAPALMAGNSVVLKPTPEAPYCAYLLVNAFVSSKYATKDALSLVYGDAEVGSELVRSDIPRVISFTGSVQVGKIITQNAGIKKVSLELGGNAATFIQKSANLKLAAKRCAIGAFINSGQVCISLQRIYVDSAIYDEFSRLLVEETKKLKVGNPYEDDTFMSSLINDDALSKALSWIESAKNEGAVMLYGGLDENGVLKPTIMSNVTKDMNIVCQEVFAPIVSLISVKDFEEAVNYMNDSLYGLQFSIFTNDLELAKRAINEFEAGGVVINDIPTLRFDVQPYGGIKLSGIGREGPRYALEEFTEIKSVVIC